MVACGQSLLDQGNTSTIFELEPTTGAIGVRFQAPATGFGLTTNRTLLYITTDLYASSCGVPSPNQIFVIDPVSEQVVRSIPNPVAAFVGGLTFLQGHVLAIGIPDDSPCNGTDYQNWQMMMVEIDPANGAILHEFPCAENEQWSNATILIPMERTFSIWPGPRQRP